MTQAEYNAKVQELQEMWGDACRVRAVCDPKTNELYEGRFEVYWDGDWHMLGRQARPLTPNASYEWWDALELKLRGAFAGALARS